MEHFPAQFNLPLEKPKQFPPIFLCCYTILEKRWGWYHPGLEAKDTTDTASSASFLDLYLEFDDSGKLSTKIYDKWDDFNLKIINFPNMCSNIPASPAYGVCISQLIRYARASLLLLFVLSTIRLVHLYIVIVTDTG